jgi:hypothetical protein
VEISGGENGWKVGNVWKGNGPKSREGRENKTNEKE